MRPLTFTVSALLLFGCPPSGGAPGPEGPQGPQGLTGPQGAAGVAGPAGAAGPAGDAGSPGPVGPHGPVGAQGVQGPPGAVLVLDGGVVSGPPGSGVVVTPIAPGPTCAQGGLRVTQLSDGGIASICNGVAGTPGAQGATGAAGAQGPAGASVTATPLAPLSAACATGGVLIGLPDGGSLAVCNGAPGATGATGAAGATGATGSAGPAGSTGPAGPPGPPGPALYLDGGLASLNSTPSFAGFTTATYTGSLGGHVGANQKCAAEFPGSSFCTVADFDLSNPAVAPPASGAWIDSDRQASGQRTQNSCTAGGGSWNLGTTADTGTNLNALGVFLGQLNCNLVKPLACCRLPSAVVFRGYTTATFNGSLGGHLGANARCAAEFPGSYFCTAADFDQANPVTAPPASGAWIDTDRQASGQRTQNSCSSGGSWNLGTTADTGTNLNPLGVFLGQVLCDQVKPLACCQSR